MQPNYEIRVGLFTLIALILLLGGWSWLKSFNFFHVPQRFIVRFHDVAGLNNNATVNINGVRVGTVEKVELVSKGAVNCAVRITADKVIVRRGSSVTIQTLGLVGAKYMEITLPELKPGEPQPPALTENDVVIGEDPVRVELVVNDMATKISKVFHSIRTDKAGLSIAQAIEYSGEAVKNINEASAKLNKNMDKFASVAESVHNTSEKIGTVASSFRNTSEKFGAAAERAQNIEQSANAFFSRGTQAMDGVQNLTQDMRGATGKINKMLDNPALSGDIKETARMAKQTAETVSKTIHEVQGTLQDKALREDLMSILGRVNSSTENIAKSMDVVKNISGDETLRTDLKQIVGNAKDAMTKLQNVMNEPTFKSDLRCTMDRVRTAADDLDYASRQVSNVLNHKAPLLHMLFGRPGQIARDQKVPSASR